jgi:uncharacterized phage-associated protein
MKMEIERVHKKPSFNEEKTTEAASIFLELCGGEMKYIKLLKLLYLLDRLALQKWERPVTNDDYFSLDFGPVLSQTYDIIKRSRFYAGYWDQYIETISYKKVRLKGNGPKISKLSDAEIQLIHQIYKEFGKIDAFRLAELTHELPEYQEPHGSSIPIKLADVLSALNYSEQDIERISSELEEEAGIVAIFGG